RRDADEVPRPDDILEEQVAVDRSDPDLLAVLLWLDGPHAHGGRLRGPGEPDLGGQGAAIEAHHLAVGGWWVGAPHLPACDPFDQVAQLRCDGDVTEALAH